MATYNGALERLARSAQKARSSLDFYKHQALAHCENHCTKQQVSKARVQADLNLIELLSSIESEIALMERDNA
jgi:extradiol dioxygenase family protein